MDFFANWETKDIVNTLIAWSALLVSLLTLAWQWWCKHPRYEIGTDPTSPNLIFKYQLTPENLNSETIKKLNLLADGLPSKSRALVYVQLFNYSEIPITITKAELEVDDKSAVLKSNHRVIGTNYFISMLKRGNKYGPYTIDMTKEQLKLPVILPPYGVEYGYILFYTNLTDDFTGTLKLFSPVKNKTIKVKIYTFENYLKENPNFTSKESRLK